MIGIISYNTATCKDLEFFLHNREYVIVNPNDFLLNNHDTSIEYINLVVKDQHQREEISQKMSQDKITRFTYIHDMSFCNKDRVGSGCFLYPNSTVYPSALVAEDCVIHSNTRISHNTSIGKGCFIGGQVNISGTANIGNYCTLYPGVNVADKINIVDNTVIGANTLVRKSIKESGTYSAKSLPMVKV